MRRNFLAWGVILASVPLIATALLAIFTGGPEMPAPATAATQAPVAAPAQMYYKRILTRAEFANLPGAAGRQWPFRLDEVEVACEPIRDYGKAVSVLIPNGPRLGINMQGRARYYDITDEFWREAALAPGVKPTGLDSPLYVILDAGLALCPGPASRIGL